MKKKELQSLIEKVMEEKNVIVKKEELSKLGIDYRRITSLVEEGKRQTFMHRK